MKKKTEQIVELPLIRVISDGRFPSHDTNTQQIVKNASALARKGLKIELCIPSRGRDNFISKNKFLDKIHSWYNVQDRLRIRRYRTLPLGRFRLERLTHGLLTPLFATIRRVKIFYSRDPLSTLLALLLRRRVVFETYRCLGDDYPKMMRFLARFAGSKKFLGIITHSRHAADSIAKQGFPREKLAPIHNGFDPEEMEPILSKSQARGLTKLPQKAKIAVYTGNMQANKGIESLVELAKELPGVKFVLVGGKPEDIERLKELARELKCENLIFTGVKPVKEVPVWLYSADLLLIPPTAAPLELYGRTVLPFKTFLYMGAGRPILGPDLPDLREVLDKKSALLLKPDALPQAAREIKKLLADEERAERLGRAAREAALKLTWEKRGEKIASWLSQRYQDSLSKT